MQVHKSYCFTYLLEVQLTHSCCIVISLQILKCLHSFKISQIDKCTEYKYTNIQVHLVAFGLHVHHQLATMTSLANTVACYNCSCQYKNFETYMYLES